LGRGEETYGVDVEVTGVEYDRPIHVVVVEILKRHVLDISISDIRARPPLKSRAILSQISPPSSSQPQRNTYLRIQHNHILNPRIIDIILDPRILANTPHTHAMRAITVQILDEDVGGIRFRTETVVADVDPGVADGEAVDVVGVPAVGVFGEILNRKI
jgi:hypothetical protein